MRKKIDKNLEFFYIHNFPYKNRKPKKFPFTATIGVGGNLGDVKRRFKKLFLLLNKNSKISIVATSAILKNPPFGYLDQPDFYNAIIVIKTSYNPKSLLDYLLKIEKRFKRKREFKNAPRTLDLDIIFFDDRVINEKNLKIPHPKWRERDSVVIPLMQIGEIF